MIKRTCLLKNILIWGGGKNWGDVLVFASYSCAVNNSCPKLVSADSCFPCPIGILIDFYDSWFL